MWADQAWQDGDPDINFDIGLSTEDEITWHLVRRWLARCLDSHEACSERAATDFVPTRLLELKKADSAVEDRMFRLVHAEQVTLSAKYLTLSHCWGTRHWHEDQKLTRSSLPRLTEYQPISRLPKTFRDAFTIVERLGMQYLWIDRFCIIQDSPEDWSAEASTMCDVYSHSFLNISALAAADDATGCFFTRDPSMITPTVFNLCVAGPGKTERHRILAEDRVWKLTFENEPLLKRGWTVQERLLAPRVVHFGRQQVFWECHGMSCCEMHPRTVTTRDHPSPQVVLQQSGRVHAWKQLLDSGNHVTTDDNVRQLFQDWYSVKKVYAACQLTVPGDKLVALSGIARDMKRRMAKFGFNSTEYFAGLWRQDMPRCLLWSVRCKGKRPPAYRAPSWSWAALDGPVFPQDLAMGLNNDREIILASVVNVTTMHNGDDTGPVTGGSLTLKGRLASARPELGDNRARFHWLPIEQIGSPDLNEIGETGILAKSQQSLDTLGWVEFDTVQDIREHVFCLPIIMQPLYLRPKESWSVYGLVLSRGIDRRYSRIGCFHFEPLGSHADIDALFPRVSEVDVEIT